MKKEKNILFRRLHAFNLQELLVVLVIIGILILIAMPSFIGVIGKAKSVEAKNQLQFIYTLQKNHHLMYSTYTDELVKIDFEAPKTTSEGGNAYYQYAIVKATKTEFVARATAVDDFDGDGIKNVWEINQDQQLTEVIKD